MLVSLAKEIEMRKGEVDDTVDTIYFGGGTPSVLSVEEINNLIDLVYRNFQVASDAEITLEANPDDLSVEQIKALSQTKINRLSIGVQSFFEEDLKLMNRAHNAQQALQSIQVACEYFDNVSLDLIYGIPDMSLERWRENIHQALDLGVQHISSYALTVEPRTALRKLIDKGEIKSPEDEIAEQHFMLLVEALTQADFVHYELSNFGKPGFFSKNNTSYWLGKKYVGIGPSAHSYNGVDRSWNIANNSIYIREILSGKRPSEHELLSQKDRYNEYIMTGLRTIWGVSLQRIEKDFGLVYHEYLLQSASKFLQTNLLEINEDTLLVTPKGKFLCDGIASELFKV